MLRKVCILSKYDNIYNLLIYYEFYMLIYYNVGGKEKKNLFECLLVCAGKFINFFYQL
jgi:hypothetical protein